MRWLGIDFGEKRIGVAVSDPEGRLAVPLTTVARRSDRAAVAALVELARREGAEALAVGEPRNLDGSRGDAARRARRFAERLAAASGLPCELVDEALTSVEAEERLRAAGLDPARRRARVDEVAAQILLQDALDRRRRPEGA
jgi:putative Holliday junction resolvase